MVDLCKLAERHFFHPQTNGSSSLKKVLPALMLCSDRLREIYGDAIYATEAMPSLNFRQPIAWWQNPDGMVRDPYDLLPPVFADIPKEEQAALELAFPDELQEGGTAMAAYVRLQNPDLPAEHRSAIEAALLRYCELDTLAMVMSVQAWQQWVATRS